MDPIANMEPEDKVMEVISRSPKYMGNTAGKMWEAMITPTNLAIMAGSLVVWAASHFFGVGEIIDVGFILVGAFTIGWSAGDVAEKLYDFATTAINAQNDRDLELAASAFGQAVVIAGIDTIMAILLKKSAIDMQAARGATASWYEVAKPRSPGLVYVGTDPAAASWLPSTRIASTSVSYDATMAAGEGATTAFGDISVSSQGTATEQQLAFFHEQVHSWLSPRFVLGRTFRAQLGQSAYARSALMMYLEEAAAETIAQLRVNGMSGFMTGIRFPVANGYVTMQSLASELGSIGSVAAGSQWF